MSREFSASETTLKTQAGTSQPRTSTSTQPSVPAVDVAKFEGTNVATGYRSLKPAPNLSMGTAQETGQQRRSPEISAQPPSRALGVQSILNPFQPDVRATDTALQSSTDQQSVYQRQTVQTAFLPPPVESPRIRKRNQRGSSTDETQPSSRIPGPRRNLTPISPGRRAESLGGRRQLPGLSEGPSRAAAGRDGRIYTVEPGRHPDSEVPPLPSSSAFPRAVSTLAHPPEPVQRRMRTASTGYSHIPAVSNFPASQSESPGTPQSSYSHVGQTSPVFSYGNPPNAQQSYQPTQAAPMAGFQYPIAGSNYGENQYPAGSGSYQMTLDTEQGPMIVPVEVDLQQASKIADEKRKRNAGASARFRARRKEKEKEAMHSISSMEKEVRDITADLEFYVNERNFFRDLAMRHLGRDRIPARPPSPPPRRPFLQRLGSDSSTAPAPESYRDLSESSPRPAVRRRTGEYQHPSLSRGTSPSPMLPPRMPFPSQYPPPVTQLPPPPPPSMPPFQGPYLEQRALPPGPPHSRPPPLPPSTTRSQSYDPFRPEHFDRSWDPGR